MKTYSFLDSIKKQEKEVMLYVLAWKNLAWQGLFLQRLFTVQVTGRQSCSFLLSSSDGSETAEEMPECRTEGKTSAAPEPYGEFSAASPLCEALEERPCDLRSAFTLTQAILFVQTQQEQAQKKQQKLRERELSLKRQQRELAKQGKKPFFLKKCKYSVCMLQEDLAGVLLAGVPSTGSKASVLFHRAVGEFF